MSLRAKHLAFVLAAASASALAAVARAHDAEDFPPRPVSAHVIQVPHGAEGAASTVIGAPRSYVFREGDTLLDVARRAGLGINEMVAAFPANWAVEG